MPKARPCLRSHQFESINAAQINNKGFALSRNWEFFTLVKKDFQRADLSRLFDIFFGFGDLFP
jgi:hypothetical protein